MSFYVADDPAVPPRFRLHYKLPAFNLPTCNEPDARWVIYPHPVLVYDRTELVAQLCEKYGAERLVLFDYSDFGDGNYPCTVFAQNTKPGFPRNVLTFLQPTLRFFGDKQISIPKRYHSGFDISFCGDGSSHPTRWAGARQIMNSELNYSLKMNHNGFLENENPMDEDYDNSFNTKLMWCPPSRRPITSRLLEAAAAGVPIITGFFASEFRTPRSLSFLYDGINFYNPTMTDFMSTVEWAMSNIDVLENKSAILQREFNDYQQNFWKFVESELTLLQGSEIVKLSSQLAATA
jgi:hypothetical protein